MSEDNFLEEKDMYLRFGTGQKNFYCGSQQIFGQKNWAQCEKKCKIGEIRWEVLLPVLKNDKPKKGL